MTASHYQDKRPSNLTTKFVTLVMHLFLIFPFSRYSSGSVDRKELRAAFNYLKLELPDSHFEALFRYLDESGNGIVEASELENALRHHRRSLYIIYPCQPCSRYRASGLFHESTCVTFDLLSFFLFIVVGRFHFCRSLVEKHEASAREAARLRSADATTNRAATAPGGATPGLGSRPVSSGSNTNGENGGTAFPFTSPMKGAIGVGRGQSYNDSQGGGGEGGLGDTFAASGGVAGGAQQQRNGRIGLSDYRRSPALGRLVTTYPAEYPTAGPVLKVRGLSQAFLCIVVLPGHYVNLHSSVCSLYPCNHSVLLYVVPNSFVHSIYLFRAWPLSENEAAVACQKLLEGASNRVCIPIVRVCTFNSEFRCVLL